MYGRPKRSHPRGGGCPQQQAAPPVNVGANFQNPNIFSQTVPAYPPHTQNPGISSQPVPTYLSHPQFQNFGFPLQDPCWPFQQNPALPPQNVCCFPAQQFPSSSVQTPSSSVNPKELLEKIDLAVIKVRDDLLKAGESVSAWNVSQKALLMLQVDSWSSLGIKMQQVSSLHRLLMIEGKVNAFVHCFVGVQRITSLYDLEVAICKHEGVDDFKDLGVGPFLRHPLVMHYFSIPSLVTEVFKITSEEIIYFLIELLDASKKGEIRVEELLDFIAKKKSVKSKELLGIRVQNLGMYISAIREVRNSQQSTLKKCLKTLKLESEGRKKRPLFSSQKKQLDERFSTISRRVETFSSAEKVFSGTHIRFTSSSEDDDSACSLDESQNDNAIVGSQLKSSSSPFGKDTERVSSCPYPSATEEIKRLGLQGDRSGNSPFNANLRKGHDEPTKKKRQSENVTSNKSAPSKLFKRQKGEVDAISLENEDSAKVVSNTNNSLSITDESLQMFVTTWKEACWGQNVTEVLERMLQFYGMKSKRRRKITLMFSSYPFIGLLNAAVSSIKSGLWNSMYDSFQAISNNELDNSHANKDSEYETIDVGPSDKIVPVVTKNNTQNINCYSTQDIIGKIEAYVRDSDVPNFCQSSVQNKITLLRKLQNCESWVTEQFCVQNFGSLGYGDFLFFLEKYVSQLPHEMLKLLVGGTCEKSSLEACMPSNQLAALMSQAFLSLWEDQTVTKQMISSLLMRQFPAVGFELMEDNSLEDFLDTLRKHKASVTSKRVLFSATMIEKYHFRDSLSHGDDDWFEATTEKFDMDQKLKISGNVTSRNAIEILLRAPMLSDLSKWSHWDLMFAPSLGSLTSWLLEVNTDELLCLVAKDGKVLRLDPSASLDSFLEAAVQGSSFQTAVNLISLFCLFGGENYVPLSLLKCHSHHAFEVMLRNALENMEVSDGRHSVLPGEALNDMTNFADISTTNTRSELCKHIQKTNKAVPILSRFVLNCVGYLPAEFHSFAADVLLSGMQSVFKDAASAILCECNKEERLMLHEVGLFLGVLEWINDYHAFISSDNYKLLCAGDSCLDAGKTKVSIGLKHDQDIKNKFPVPEENMIESSTASGFIKVCCELGQAADIGKSNNDELVYNSLQDESWLLEEKDASLVIESIRRDEFGLDPSLSDSESNMLKKQHARLGRAVHCLSQELYSQDSHFILELVQNADDNNYPENEEPTLIFILHDSGIVVLNNEQGFSAENMRALCDVGNSTKKGSNAGYIGQKGIGFKSVFRVTDAPEIHSNGFHVKFDISEGQIGFVLPTVVHPCDIGMFSRMASTDIDSCDTNPWKTCILLPFRSHLSEGTIMNSIISMFSDLHPSLLLFLHRLKCLKLRNLLNDTLTDMRKEIVGDGIVRVSYGEEKMTWFVVSQKLQVPPKLQANSLRLDVQTTEISMAFTLQESDNSYSPCLDQQPVFAFLPLRTYGLKFILQGDFVLPSSREEVDGDSPWNQWLLSEYPSLFIRAQREFCELPSFRSNPGKALSAFMSFVPLVGEVHGFFFSLPRLIINNLRMANCLLVDSSKNQWAPPCKVLRGWTEQVRSILTDDLLYEHIGLRFLDKDVELSDALSKALGIREFGVNILVEVMSKICSRSSGMISMGMSWLASFLDTIYVTLSYSSGKMSGSFETREDILESLKQIPFIPLSDGAYSSVSDGTIWLHLNSLSTGFDGVQKIEVFPNICANLRTVAPSLLSSSSDTSCLNSAVVDNVTRLLQSIGVQKLSGHDIVKLHILPAMSDVKRADQYRMLMIEYICFVMLHLRSTCSECFVERELIISELRCKSLLLTNYGFKNLGNVPIHFSRDYGNPVNAKMLADTVDMNWPEIDINYLKHPVNESLSCGLENWREFFQEIGITDFAQIVQVDKSVADVCDFTFKHVMLDKGLISPELLVKDWESPELVQLLTLLSTSSSKENCQHLLEILDTLWDACYSDKTTSYFSKSDGDDYPFKTSLMHNMCDMQWVASTMDDELHYPKDLFYDCEAVRMILGASAPYAVPKVRSERLVSDIGFKTRVTLSDILEILRAWRKLKPPFNASITQMSRLYAFIWNEMTSSRQKTMEQLMSGPFIFIPNSSVTRHDDVVCGILVPPSEVYWHDLTGSVDQVNDIGPQSCSNESTCSSINKSLCKIYPGLRGFFVDECGVHEAPPMRSYIHILQQLSTVTLPSQAANKVLNVFLKWADELKSGKLSIEDLIYLKECLSTLEFPVLPTIQDKWVSLHPSFGLVCWCDDDNLKKEFKHSDNLDFLYLGELADEDQDILQQNLSILLKALGISSVSEIVTREAIYYGLADCGLKASLINWALPYAQRYIYKVHNDKFFQLKESGFDFLNHLKVIVVEKLFYRNVIKVCGGVSKKRVECSCLLQENILYATQAADHHSLFMELSRLLFDGTPELHLANFLHMITTMAESGSSKEQIEFFILNSQNVPDIPDEESVWTLSLSSLMETNNLQPSDHVQKTNEQIFPKRKTGVYLNWPPADWKTAPDFSYARANGFKTQAAQTGGCIEVKKDDSDSLNFLPFCADPESVAADWTIEDEQAGSTAVLVLHESDNLEDQSCQDSYQTPHTGSDTVSLEEAIYEPCMSSAFSKRDQLITGTPDAAQARATGRLGELLSHKYFVRKVGKAAVKWVNESKETGLPYDLVIGEEPSKEYIEVKSTRSSRKDWFNITVREWQFAVDKGESFSIVHVALTENNVARITIFKDPVKLCQQGLLQLAVLMPKQREFSAIS
ncbi:protein NO VEIN [Prosopis cineraria]|uniref:protein NO VEIN n=1 Tax=Prosopis cineraria TaxID=364024 RepID=UPI00240EEB51|nr:protein NO VEIN [Prosopis cineraria]